MTLATDASSVHAMWIPGYGSRAFWLIVFPTFCAFIPWTDALRNSRDTGIAIVEVCSPLAGLIGVLGFKAFSRQHVALWPYLPFAIPAIFAASTFTIWLTSDAMGDGLLFVQIMCLLFQPFAALAVGLVSFKHREQASR